VIEQSKGIQGALAMGDRLARICGPAMTACVWFDERVFTGELVAAGISPILLATRAAMKKKERLSDTFSFVICLNTVEGNAFGCHGGHYGGRWGKKQPGKCA
jgi:hypothetical protein